MENKYEAEIDLQDMALYVLHKWRSLLLGTIILGILLGGYKFVFNVIEINGETQKTQEERLYEISLAKYELSKVTYERDIATYQMRLKEHEAYVDNSALMRTDPYHKPTASADFFVKLDSTEWEGLPDSTNLDPTDSLIAIYTSNFLPNIEWKPIEELSGLEEIYCKELLTMNADYNSNTFTVNVVYNDGEIAQKILELVVSQLLAKGADIGADISRHTLSVVSTSLTYGIDNTLADFQKANIDATSEFELAILDCQNKLENLVKPKRPHGVLRFFLLGLAAGFFMTAVFHCAMYLMGGKLHSEKEIQERYGYPFLGVLPNSSNTVYVSRILHLWGKTDKKNQRLPMDERCRLIAAKITRQIEPETKILVTGTVSEEKLQEFAKAITVHLQTVSMEAAADLSSSADSLKAFEACDSVLLLEERNRSRRMNIEREEEDIRMLRKKVIGYVLL